MKSGVWIALGVACGMLAGDDGSVGGEADLAEMSEDGSAADAATLHDRSHEARWAIEDERRIRVAAEYASRGRYYFGTLADQMLRWPPQPRCDPHPLLRDMSELAAFAQTRFGQQEEYRFVVLPADREPFACCDYRLPETNLLVNEEDGIRMTLVGEEIGMLLRYQDNWQVWHILRKYFSDPWGHLGTDRCWMTMAALVRERPPAQLPDWRRPPIMCALYRPFAWCVASPHIQEKRFPFERGGQRLAFDKAYQFRTRALAQTQSDEINETTNLLERISLAPTNSPDEECAGGEGIIANFS